jgi:integrase
METTKKALPLKPEKPYPGFPLFPHATRRWAKKIHGQLRYFGPWDDPQGALGRWLEQREDLMAGREPKEAQGHSSVRDVVNAFLTSKQSDRDKGELSPRTFNDYYRTCERVINCFGKTGAALSLTQNDFQIYATKIASWAPVTRSNEIQRVRTLFKYAYEAGLIDKPVLFGPDFKKPKARTLRADRNAKPTRMFAPTEIRSLLKKAGVQLKAMILLGINCGLGNADISGLNWAHLGLAKGLLDYPRPKTAVDRRATLWPETIKALKAVKRFGANPLSAGDNKGQPRYRPIDSADSDAVFLTLQQRRFVRHENSIRDSVAMAFGKLLRSAGIKREGVNFYSLRHTFETAAMGGKDREATDRIMGHADPHIRTNYQHWQKDASENERLRGVTDHVRKWLFTSSPAKKPYI